MPATYEKIASTTLGSASNTITFNSLSSAYTDLKVIFVGKGGVGGEYVALRFNSDTATNYSATILAGYGSAASARETNQTGMYVGNYFVGLDTSIPAYISFDIFSYNGSTFKTVLGAASNDLNGSGETVRSVGLWRSTSAITSLSIITGSGTMATGSIATLYGILKA